MVAKKCFASLASEVEQPVQEVPFDIELARHAEGRNSSSASMQWMSIFLRRPPSSKPLSTKRLTNAMARISRIRLELKLSVLIRSIMACALVGTSVDPDGIDHDENDVGEAHS